MENGIITAEGVSADVDDRQSYIRRADRGGALEAALKAGFAYGGLVPKGRLADQYLARFIEDQVEGSDSK